MTEELNNYSNLVNEKAQNRENFLILNDGVAHNAIIMTGMFNNAKEICMFCGEGSIFLDDFGDKVKEENAQDSDIINALHKAIKEFIGNINNSLKVIVENNASFKENISKNLRESLQGSNVKFYLLDNKIAPEYHFSIGDNCMYRREIGRREHKAFVNFNDEDIVKLFKEQFSMLTFFSGSFNIEKEEKSDYVSK